MPARVDPSEILRQRELGWPDFHPEDYCHRCGVEFESWFCDRETWLQATSRWAAETGRDGICCVTCFSEMHKASTGAETIWKVEAHRWE
jgi:hypothetical protein